MSTAKPVDLRQMMVDGLYRSMVGPIDGQGNLWLGEHKTPIDPTDPSFKVDGYPVGPWEDSQGREIINSNPLQVYTVGVVYPILDESARDLIVTEESEIEGDESELAPTHKETEELDGDGGLDDDNASDDVRLDPIFQGPRSMSFSVSPGENQEHFEIRLRCGLYSPVRIAGQGMPWWIRDVVDVSVSLRAGESSSVLLRPDLGVRIGVDSRTAGNGHRLVTIWVRNDSRVPADQDAAAFALFQTRLSARFVELQPVKLSSSSTYTSLDFLYRHVTRLAIGHGCDAVVSDENEGFEVCTDVLPTVKISPLSPDIRDKDKKSYAVGMNDLADFNSDAQDAVMRIMRDYEAWIDERSQEVQMFNAEDKAIASHHLEKCRGFLADIRYGWELCAQNSDVKRCFQDASRAMNQQRAAYGSPLREARAAKNELGYEFDKRVVAVQEQGFWRPFQIAFVLASLRKVVDLEFRKNEGRDVDVIWMPTGGGKTEAYLGLAAFTILWTRFVLTKEETKTGEKVKPSMKVLMRYTYRLLTVQQVARAASMVCALELMRNSSPDRYGSQEIRIGAWLGNSVTPGKRKDAIKRLNDLKAGKDAEKFLLKKCPWCGAQIGVVINEQVVGYKETATLIGANRVLAFCPDSDCEFHVRKKGGGTVEYGLPFLDVDEDLYAGPPDFLIATVDKIARLAWSTDSHRLFGIRGGKRVADPPQLFIQDELHLIAGPLGSLDGVFEIALEELCRQMGGRSPVYVASTATTKNFEDQIHNLYDRQGRLVPPPGLTIENSFFGQVNKDGVGKIYVGVCATGSFSGLDVQNSVLASLGFHAAVLGPTREDHNVDPWWTNVVFFSSRRALGLLQSLIDTSLHRRVSRLRALSGRRSGKRVVKNGEPKDEADRYMIQVSELTATSAEDVNEVFDKLEKALPDTQTTDLCFATSMVEVGLDVSRLGLMTVIGQPKSSSQYIQATGRVGRSDASPGLVVSVLKPTNARDLSHYEGFRFWHERLYASVESASVTPFTSRALERSLPSFMAILLRSRSASDRIADALPYWEEVCNVLFARIGANSAFLSNAQAVLDMLYAQVTAADAASYVWDSWPKSGRGQPLMYSAEESIPADRLGTPMWFVMNSMRSVEADAMLKVVLPEKDAPNGPQNPGQPVQPGPVGDDGDDF
jgi:hypothetical protein